MDKFSISHHQVQDMMSIMDVSLIIEEIMSILPITLMSSLVFFFKKNFIIFSFLIWHKKLGNSAALSGIGSGRVL